MIQPRRSRASVAFGSLTGLISGFVVTLAVCLLVLGAADPDSGLKLSIPGTHHRSDPGAGVTDDSATAINDGPRGSLPISTTPPAKNMPSAPSGHNAGTSGGSVTATTRPATEGHTGSGGQTGSGGSGGSDAPATDPVATSTGAAPVVTLTQSPAPSPVPPSPDPETPVASDPAAGPALGD